MKKLIFVGFFLSAIMISLNACSKKKTTLPNTEQNDFYSKIGLYHNSGLDFMLESLKVSVGKEASKEEWMYRLSKLNEDLVSFSKSDSRYFAIENDSQLGLVVNALTNFEKRSNTKSSVNNPYTNIKDYINDNIQNYLDLMSTAIDNHDNLDDIVMELNEIKSKIEFEVNSEFDKFVLLSAVEVAIASCEYWWENIIEWRDAFNADGKISPQAAAKNIAKADLAGAAGGAAYAWILNAVPGAGQVAYGSTIGTVALGASTYEAALAIINWLWP